MRRPLFVLLLAATAIAQPIRQQKSVGLYELPNSDRMKPPTVRVRELIRQLGAANPDAHAAAERALLSLCPGIEPQLRYAFAEEEKSAPARRSKSDPVTQEYVRGGVFSRFQPADLLPRSVYHSLDALLERCEELRHTRPTLVTLNASDALLSDIFRDLGQQAGAAVSVVARSYDGAVDPAALDWFQSARATVRLDRVTYWDALRTILGTIHPPALRSVQLFVDIGNNQVQLNPSTSDSIDVFRDPNAVSFGPLLLLAGYQPSPMPSLTVTAVADPALAGFTGDSSLHFESVTDNEGQSLLLDDSNTSSSGGLDEKDFDRRIGYAYDNADGKFSWRQSLPIKAPDSGRSLTAARGTFRVGFGVNEKFMKHEPDNGYPTNNIGISLAPFHPEDLGPKPDEEQIYLLQDCKMLHPQSADQPVYVQDHLDCHARGIERSSGRAGRDTIEGATLTLTNHREHAVTYVAGLTYFVDPAPGFPRPDQVVDAVGIYHAHAEPGQTVRISMATSYREGSRSHIPEIPDAIPAEASSAKPQSVVFDGWQLSVLSVTRSGESYEIVGQLALPAPGPFGDTAVGAGYIFLNPLDAQGWQIESYPRFSKIRREGDHLLEDFKVVTREPGRIPVDLLWQTPSATHWLSTPFELRRFNENEAR